jgi:hypothetical protein
MEDKEFSERMEALESRLEVVPEKVKKQVGVQLPVNLWWQFREEAMRERISASSLLQKIVADYLRSKGQEPKL